ncbi:MAG TPA: response regulator, partial [Desulfosarcina sp.]|nr:response regulator [Desulfosarcina sp.]
MNKTVLLVDDEAGIRNTLSLLLNDMGYDVVSAENGNNALKIFGRTRPPVVLTDIKMPGLDGIGLLKAIKKQSPDTEVIMMTGHGDVELAVESLKNEATDFITKPILTDAVEIALNRAFKRIDDRQQLREYTRNLEALVEEKSKQLLEAERLNAVGQAVEGLASAIMGLPGDLDDDLSYFSDLPCFVSLHNRDLEILTANQTYYERIGAHRDGRSWDLYTGGAASPDNCPVAVTFRTEKGQRSSETLLVDGKEVPLAVFTAPVRDRTGAVTLVIEFLVDISQISRLQEAFQYARERYHQLFNEVPCYITVHDPYLRITEANRLFRETFGEGIGEHCYEVYKHRSTPCTDCPVRKTFEDGETHSQETVVISAAGDRYNVLVYTSPIRDRDGNITRVIEMSTDITQIHQLRDQLSSLGLLISSISHGIKGMLTGLDGGV